MRARDLWLSRHPQPWNDAEISEYAQKFEHRVDRWLALGRGEAVLKDRGCRAKLLDILMFYEGKETRMDAIVIMPNHVHVLVQLLGNRTLSRLMHSWKSYSSSQLNQMLRRYGPLWGRDYWDRMIRSPTHYRYVRRYIAENPAKARLPESMYTLWMRATPLWEDLKKEGYAVRNPWGCLGE